MSHLDWGLIELRRGCYQKGETEFDPSKIKNVWQKSFIYELLTCCSS